MSVVEQRPVVQEAVHAPLGAQDKVENQNLPKNENASLVNRLAKNIFVQLGLILAAGAICVCMGLKSTVLFRALELVGVVCMTAWFMRNQTTASDAAIAEKARRIHWIQEQQKQEIEEKKRAIEEVNGLVLQAKAASQTALGDGSIAEKEAAVRATADQAVEQVALKEKEKETKIEDARIEKLPGVLDDAARAGRRAGPEVVGKIAKTLQKIDDAFYRSTIINRLAITQAEAVNALALVVVTLDAQGKASESKDVAQNAEVIMQTVEKNAYVAAQAAQEMESEVKELEEVVAGLGIEGECVIIGLGVARDVARLLTSRASIAAEKARKVVRLTCHG